MSKMHFEDVAAQAYCAAHPPELETRPTRPRTFTAAIEDEAGWRECGSTDYARALVQLRAAEDAVAGTPGARAVLLGNDRRGRRLVLAEFLGAPGAGSVSP